MKRNEIYLPYILKRYTVVEMARKAAYHLARQENLKAKGILFAMFWEIVGTGSGDLYGDPLPPGAWGKKISYHKCSRCRNFNKIGDSYFCWDRYNDMVYPLQWQYFCPMDEYWTKEQKKGMALPPNAKVIKFPKKEV